MEPLLEQQRRLHEERERLVDAMVGEALIKAQGQPVLPPQGQLQGQGGGAQSSLLAARKQLR